MLNYKRLFVLLLIFSLISLVFYLLFVKLDMFPNKYTLVESTPDQLVMETGVIRKEKIVASMEDNFELGSTIIKQTLSHIDVTLTFVSLAFAHLILLLIGFFINRDRKKQQVANTIMGGVVLASLLFLYYQQVSVIETLIY